MNRYSLKILRLFTISPFLIFFETTGAAWATGNLDCSTDDKTLEFWASAIVPYRDVKPIIHFKSGLKLKPGNIPQDLKTLEFDEEHLIHHWIHGRDIKLHLYWDRSGDSPADMELVIETRSKPGDELDSFGHYELTLSFKPDKAPEPRVLKFRGPISCSLG